jgi:hypothetical protein
MKFYVPACFTCLVFLLLMPTPSHAGEDNACSFNPPSAVLQPRSYPKQTFRRGKNNEASESAQISKDVRLVVHRSQCTDFIVTEFAFNLSRSGDQAAERKDWLDYAIAEITRLNIVNMPVGIAGLLAFLKNAHAVQPLQDVLSACRDGSHAAPGECSWDSAGGYIFKVTKTKSLMHISVTEYVSG